METKVRIYSIFQSVDGEVNNRGIGSPATFIRFAGCSANCQYCDTEYAKPVDSGSTVTVGQIIKSLELYGCNNVTITGGEPLEQEQALQALLYQLVARNYNVSVETNGLNKFTKLLKPYMDVHWVVDIKQDGLVLMDNYILMALNNQDIIKMVVGTEQDFKDAVNRKKFLQDQGVTARFAFSPMYNVSTPNKVLGWIKKYNQVDSMLNVQLHKVCQLDEAN